MSEPRPVVLDLTRIPPDPSLSSRVFQSSNVSAAALSLHYSSSRHPRLPLQVGDSRSLPSIPSHPRYAAVVGPLLVGFHDVRVGMPTPLDDPPSASVAVRPAAGGPEPPRPSLPLSEAPGPNRPAVAGFVPAERRIPRRLGAEVHPWSTNQTFQRVRGASRFAASVVDGRAAAAASLYGTAWRGRG